MKENKILQRIFRSKHLGLVLVSGFLLFFSYAFNIFGLGQAGFFDEYQKDSESLVVNEVECHSVYGKDVFGGMLVSGGEIDKTKNEKCSTKLFSPYISQFNIEGKIITFFSPSSSSLIGIYINIVRLVVIFALVVLMVWLILGVTEEFSLVVGLTLLSGLLVSDWMVYMARNLYWVPFLLFLPFVISFNLYPNFKRNKKLRYFYFLLGALFFVKSLAGYEFLSPVILSSFAPILYWEVKDAKKLDFNRLVKPFFLVVGMGIGAFVLALILHIVQLGLYFHSFSEGLKILQTRALDRTVGESGNNILVNLIDQAKYIEHYLYYFMNSIYYLPNFSSTSHYFLPGAILLQSIIFLFLDLYSLPFELKQPLGFIVQSLAFSIFLTGLIGWIWYRKRILKSSKQHLAVFIATIYAFFASISWIFLAHPHAIHHLHLIGITYYLPYALMFYILTGVALKMLVSKIVFRKIL